jgi:DNA-binding LacI/PurR family transcriptional regulator/anti-anti-sigma regulatory factor
MWSGVEAGAREQDLNLIAFPGGNIRVKTEGQANIIYDLVTPETFAGLVVWASALQHPMGQYESLSEEELGALHARYHPLPIVTLSKAVPGHPVVLVESECGMRDAIAHLIEVHGCRRIAFIRGPEAHPLAEARYRAYLDTLADRGIKVNADLVTPAGAFSRARGVQAVDLFLDERNLRPKEDLEAIVTASDLFALGAMDALQRRSIRVPRDVAVVGFNNSAEARFASPPITSVVVPFREQGMKAVHALKRVLEGKSVPDEMIVPSRLAIHQSCGCLDVAVTRAGTFSPGVGDGVSLEEAFAARREAIVREMAQVMDVSEVPVWVEKALDGFILDLGGSQPGRFLTALQDALWGAPLVERSLPAWQNMLSVLQRHAVSYVDSQKALLLIGQARAMLGETASRAFAQRQVQVERRVQTLQEFSAELVATFEMEELMDVLAEGLTTLGIPGCYLALYEDPQPYVYPQPAPEWSRLILAYDEGGRVALEPGGRRFPTRRILPEGLLPAHRRYTMVLQPLYFQNSQIGFALFEVEPRDWSLYEVLRGEVASVLQGALLVQAQKETEAALEKAYAEVEQQVAERTAELKREQEEKARAQAESLRLQQEVIDAQQRAIRELSTPIIPVLEGVIVMPLIGAIDTTRARDVTRSLLAGIREHQARVVILDITGVPVVDSGVAAYLNKTVQAARLKGARTIVTGISDVVAETIVDLGIDWSGIETLRDLQTGLRAALQESRNAHPDRRGDRRRDRTFGPG